MRFIKKFIPPVVWDWLYQSPFRRYGWFGNYQSWADAELASKGYGSSQILNEVKDATLQVKNGLAAYERDSVLFDKIEYDWPVLSGVLWAAAQSKGHLDIVDFGGSLGSTFWQNRKFINSLSSVHWNIVEQPNFVEYGKRFIQDERIRFYTDLESCLQENQPSAILLSSVLSYVEKPYELIHHIASFGIEFVIIDRLLTIEGINDRLTVQKVPPNIYAGSYPSWFFGYEKIKSSLESYFDIVEEFDCGWKTNIRSSAKGFILRKKSNFDKQK